jgi:hypothetical protein
MVDVKKAIDEAIQVLEELPCQTSHIERVTHGLRLAWDASFDPEPSWAVEFALRRAARSALMECEFVLADLRSDPYAREALAALSVLREQLGLPPKEKEFFAKNDVNRLMALVVEYGAKCHELGARLGQERVANVLPTGASWTDKRKEELLGDIRLSLHASLGTRGTT